MKFERGSGVLLHPTSLPGPHGSGDIGPEAVRFLDWMQSAGQRYWQMLPLVPAGYGGSPYSGLSAFAANPYLISPERLAERGFLHPEELTPLPGSDPHRLDAAAQAHRDRLLALAAARFESHASGGDRANFEAFREQQAAWLADWALFAALRERHDNAPWLAWPEPLARRDDAAMAEARSTLAERIRVHELLQFFFHEQWTSLRAEAHARGIRIVGDVPIFVAHDSADVWAHPELFKLDSSGRPTVIAGVPPDFFSETGQRWGNPLYRWDVLESTGFQWWIDRLRATFAQVDWLRIDHFRGFAACWEIPASEETAINGRWVPVPGAALFAAVREALGVLPIIAEDLGVITPDVVELRDSLGFPGMRILQFAFDSGPTNAFLPHNYVPHTVAYTGTHDNDTTVGWWQSIREAERDAVRRYAGRDGHEPHWDLMRLGLASVARLFVAPMQDVMGLDARSRMNQPGVGAGNWGWRFTWDQVRGDAASRLRTLCEIYGRLA